MLFSESFSGKWKSCFHRWKEIGRLTYVVPVTAQFKSFASITFKAVPTTMGQTSLSLSHEKDQEQIDIVLHI